MPNQDITLSQAEGRAAFSINRPCDRSQILVTVNRNGGQWLSPIGWVNEEKGTLLDCHPRGKETQIDIPKDYAAQLQSGDKLHVSCYELDIDQTLSWSADSLTPAKSAASAAAATALAKPSVKGLFGRFKSAPTPQPLAEPMSDVARRAEEAQRAADDIRAQMEAAHLAKEAAHQRALDAARLAEEARKAEDQRIEEMKRATLALEEAEAQRREELARLEEERRAEEARRVEEARLAEEARKLAEARARQAELREERIRLSETLETVKEQREAMQGRVDVLSTQIKTAKRAASDKSKEVKAFQSSLGDSTEGLAARQTTFETANSKLQALQNKVKASENALHACTREGERVDIQVSKSQAAYEAAQRAADEAVQRAKDMKAKAEAAKIARTDIVERAKALKAENKAALASITSANADSDMAKRQFESLREKVTTLETQYETLRREEAELVKASQIAEQNLQDAQAELQTVQAQETATQSAISLIDKGEDIDAVRSVMAAAPAISRKEDQADKDERPAPRRRRFGRRAAALSAAPAALYAGAKTNASEGVKAEAAPDKTETETKADSPDKPAALAKEAPTEVFTQAANDSGRKQTYKALAASVAAIAVVAAMGIGLSQLGPVEAKPEPISAKPAKVTTDPAVALETLNPSPANKAEETAPNTEPVDIKTDAALEIPAETVTNPNLTKKTASAPKNAEQETLTSPMTAKTEKSGFQKPALAAASKLNAKPSLSAAIPKTAPAKTAPSKPVTSAALKTQNAKLNTRAAAPKAVATPPKTVAAAIVQTPKREPASVGTMMDVQSKLAKLGFYSGDIDGKSGSNTDKAIVEFKTLFGLPKDARMSGEFLNALGQADRDVRRQDLAPAQPVTVATAKPASPAPQPIKAPVIDLQPEPKIVETASLTPIAVAPAVAAQDVIVEAKRLSPIRAQYPSNALRREFYNSVTVEVSYDVSKTGEVENVTLAGMEGDSGAYTRYFERAGLKAVSRQKFSPKTVNSIPVRSEDVVSRIRFQVE